MTHIICFCRLFFVAVFAGVCQMAQGTIEISYSAIVTNVPGATHVTLDGMRARFGDWVNHQSRTVQLEGIVAPEKGSPEEAALLDILRKTLLGRRVNVVDLLDSGESRGASIYVSDDPKRLEVEDNVNLMLFREGFARFSGGWRLIDSALFAVEDIQRQAKEARKGVWATLEVTPESAQPPEQEKEKEPSAEQDMTNSTVTSEEPSPGPALPDEPQTGRDIRWFALAALFACAAGLAVWRRIRQKQ